MEKEGKKGVSRKSLNYNTVKRKFWPHQWKLSQQRLLVDTRIRMDPNTPTKLSQCLETAQGHVQLEHIEEQLLVTAITASYGRFSSKEAQAMPPHI